MLRALLLLTYFIASGITSLFFLVFIKLFSEKDSDRRTHWVHSFTMFWSKSVLWFTGARIVVKGKENLLHLGSVLFVSNHQGNLDIPLLVGFIDKPKGFIAKLELNKFPIINIWMKATRCILMERKNARQSLKVIEKGRRLLSEGYSLVVFPEGTRSRANNLGRFRGGSLKVLRGTGASIVPIAIKGVTQTAWKKKSSKDLSLIEITILPPVFPKEYEQVSSMELSQKLREKISNCL